MDMKKILFFLFQFIWQSCIFGSWKNSGDQNIIVKKKATKSEILYKSSLYLLYVHSLILIINVYTLDTLFKKPVQTCGQKHSPSELYYYHLNKILMKNAKPIRFSKFGTNFFISIKILFLISKSLRRTFEVKLLEPCPS